MAPLHLTTQTLTHTQPGSNLRAEVDNLVFISGACGKFSKMLVPVKPIMSKTHIGQFGMGVMGPVGTSNSVL